MKSLWTRSLAAFAFLSLLCASSAWSGDLLDISGVAELVAEKAKEARAAGLVSVAGGVGGSMYLPIWTLHSRPEEGKPTVDYAHCGLGGQLLEGGRGGFFVLPLALNLPALSARLWSSPWAQDHVRRSKFPPVFVGPFFRLPVPWRAWVVGSEVGGLLSIGLGK